MIEVAMGVCLTIMGIYFFKSTDLPKELKERSAQMQAQSPQRASSLPKRLNFAKEMTITKSLPPEIDQVKLKEMSLLKKAAELKLHNEEIDKLTLTITTLEQEIRINNEKNSEIQEKINLHLISLQLLQEKVISLS